jgi:hypothetical protein
VYFFHYCLSNTIVALVLILLINSTNTYQTTPTINIETLDQLKNNGTTIFVLEGKIIKLSDQVVDKFEHALWDVTFLNQGTLDCNRVFKSPQTADDLYPKILFQYDEYDAELEKVSNVTLDDLSPIYGTTPITFTFDQLFFDPYLVLIGKNVLDLTRFKMFNPALYSSLNQNILDLFLSLNDLYSILDPDDSQKFRDVEYKNRDVTKIFAHFIPFSDQEIVKTCILNRLKVGTLEGPSYFSLLGMFVTKWGIYSYIIFYLIGFLMIILSKISLDDTLCWKFMLCKRDHVYRADRKLTKKQINCQIQRNQAENYLVQQTYLRQLPTYESVNIDYLLKIEGRSPACLTFHPRELNRGLYHLAQSEPDYEREDDLDFDPLRTLLVVYSPAKPMFDQVEATLQSLAKSKYPATHKLIAIIIDGPYHQEDRTMELLCDDVIPREEIKYANYYAVDGTINKAKVFAGYYKYMNVSNDGTPRGSLQSIFLKVPLMVIYKSQAKGRRDSMALMLHLLNKVYFRSPLNPFEYDFFNLTRAIAGTTLDHFSLLLTTSLGVYFDPNTLTNLIRPFILDRSIAAATGNSYIGARSGRSLGQRFQTGLYTYEKWLNKLTYMYNSPLSIPRYCAIYRIWASSKLKTSLLDLPEAEVPSTIDPSLRNPRPILIHPHVVSKYSQLSLLGTPHEYRKKDFGWNTFENSWCEDAILTEILGKEFPNMHFSWIEKAKFQLNTPFSLLNCCVYWLKWWNISWKGAWTIRRFGITSKVICLISWIILQFSVAITISLVYALIKNQAFTVLGLVITIPLGNIFSIMINQDLINSKFQLYLLADMISGWFLNFMFHLIIPTIAIWNFNDIVNHPTISSNIPKFSNRTKSNAILPKSAITEVNPNWHIHSPKLSANTTTPIGSSSWMDPKFTNKMSLESWRELYDGAPPSPLPQSPHSSKFASSIKSTLAKKKRANNLQIRVREELFNQQRALAQYPGELTPIPKTSSSLQFDHSVPLFSPQDWGKLTQHTISNMENRLSHLRSSPALTPRILTRDEPNITANTSKFSISTRSIDSIIGYKGLKNPKASYLVDKNPFGVYLPPPQRQNHHTASHQHSPSDAPTDITLTNNSLGLSENAGGSTAIPLFIEPKSPSIENESLENDKMNMQFDEDAIFNKSLDDEKYTYWLSTPRPWNHKNDEDGSDSNS